MFDHGVLKNKQFEASWNASSQLWAINQQNTIIENVAKLTTTTLMILGDEDTSINNQVARHFYGHIPAEDKLLVQYPEMDHFMLELDGSYQIVQQNIIDWINKRLD